ncbi:MAG: hypothetical protein LBQ58_09950 [Synergistaceae bacterium]|jgi:hypothetical protein|nr:hypothetical protein [Synergistaceae bacterium]
MIESFIEGRVRLRSPILADEEFASYLVSELMRIDGVLNAVANTRTSGLLLEYDKNLLPLSLLLRATPLFSRMNDLEKLPVNERISAAGDIMKELSNILR